jgi:tRNA1Val (adenine37-N6)-methyltransferase
MGSEFHFKQFTVRQNGAAMKVGTDGVLLGAWAPLDGNPRAILDIGAGTGLIALMLAQRSEAGAIDGLEIDARAFEVCTVNFEESPWADRLFCYHAGLLEFAEEFGPEYDLIVSNPPFHPETVGSGEPARDQARQQRSLPFEVLLGCASRLLTPEGRLCVIIPFRWEGSFLEQAKEFGLYPGRITRVRGNPASQTKRSLICLERQPAALQEDDLIIEEKRHVYTEAYSRLTRDFYLKG